MTWRAFVVSGPRPVNLGSLRRAFFICNCERQKMNEKLAVPVSEACERLGIGKTLFYDLVRGGDVRTFKIGTRTAVPVADLVAFIERKLGEAA